MWNPTRGILHLFSSCSQFSQIFKIPPLPLYYGPFYTLLALYTFLAPSTPSLPIYYGPFYTLLALYYGPFYTFLAPSNMAPSTPS